MSPRFKKISLFLILSAFVFGAATVAHAQLGDPNAGDTFGVAQVGETVKLGASDPREIAGRFINIALGVLGLITVVLILYGGFLYMTSNGSEEKIAEGKKYIINATIGLVIILSAWAIVLFVFRQLTDAIVGDGGTGSGSSDPIDGPACNPEIPGDCDNQCKKYPGLSACEDRAFYVKSITPGNLTTETALTTDMNNIVIRVLFSHALASDTNVSKSVAVQEVGGTNIVPTSVSLLENNRLLEIQYAPNGKLMPFKAETTYVVTVNKELKDSQGKSLESDFSLNGVLYPTVAHFEVNKEINDTYRPSFGDLNLNGLYGDDLVFAQGTSLSIAGQLHDRRTLDLGGNSIIKISISSFQGGSPIQTVYTAPQISLGSTKAFDFNYSLLLDNKYVPGQKYVITLVGHDIDNNVSNASLVFVVKANHCTNGVQDADETGVDSGGSCGGGDGDSCSLDSDCANGFQCIDKVCRAVPMITGIDPQSGAVGNWVSVLGKNFGGVTGKIEFGVDANANGVYESAEWTLASVVTCSNKNSWTDRWVIVSVPELPVNAKAAIRLTTASGKKDISVGGIGKLATTKGLFTVTNVKKPGLCDVSVTAETVITKNGTEYRLFPGDQFAPPGVGVQVTGNGLGKTAAGSVLTFGATKKSDDTILGGVVGEIVDNYWTDALIRTRVPANMTAGLVAVHATVNGLVSNGVPFQILGTDLIPSVPVISSITPVIPTPKSYITIQGKGFGNSTGQIFIASSANTVKTCGTTNPDASCQALKVTDLATQCGDTWTDTQVIAQMPAGSDIGLIAAGNKKTFNVILKTADAPVQKTDGAASLTAEFGPEGIALCKIEPNRGPAPLPADSTPITIYGVNVPQANALEVIYWKKGAVANPGTNSGIEGWLYSLGDLTPDGKAPVVASLSKGTGFTTRLPVSDIGESMSSGPIRVLDPATGRWSNAVNYTVESCIGSKNALPGYHCCESGPESGQWKKNNLACAGESRAAGYVWRFMTGILTNQPKVVEQCNDTDFPSPTPRQKQSSAPNENSCVNATIALRFNMGMDPTTLNKENIKLFACATAPGNRIDCETKKTKVESVDISYQSGGNTVIIREAPPKPNLDSNTWYQVELSDKVASLEYATVLGVSQPIKTPLLANRTCGAGTSYCFTFKTNDSQCTLAGAGINPPNYNVRNLGVIQDSRYPFDSSKVFVPPQLPAHPFYYLIWGKGNQECSVISSQLVDTYNWKWSPQEGELDSEKATATKAPIASAPGITGYDNIRAVVTARSHTAPETATIKAEAVVEVNGTIAVTDIGGINILQAANVTVGQTGFAPTAPVTLTQAVSNELSLQNNFALQLTFKQPEKDTFPNNTLLQKVNTSIPGKPTGYVIKFINNQICLNPFKGSGASSDLCSTLTADASGQYNVVLVGDKAKNSVFWVDLVPPNRPIFTIPISAVPNSGNALAILAAEKNPLNAKGPVFFGLKVSGSVPNFLTSNPGITLSPTSTLLIDLADPTVSYFEPNCIESCNNASIRVDFNRQMATTTYASGFVVYKCMDGVVCQNAQPTSIYTVDLENSTQITLRANLSSSGPNLEANQYYKVSLNGTNLSIKSIARTQPLIYGKPLPPTQWVFKTRSDAKPCGVGFLQVTPLDLIANTVGQQDKYTVMPYSSPNACSKVGQALNKWAYQYSWQTENQNVAKISQLPAAQYSNISPFCTAACLKKGSSVVSDSPAKNDPLCGNGKVEIGEDCDIGMAGETVGKSCSLRCVRTGNLDAYSASKTGANICGNGQVEKNVGEQCDPGNENGKVKSNSPTCSTTCQLRGSQSKTNNIPGVAVCGDGEVTAGQETCDIADPTTKNGCSVECLNKGTPTASSWCLANQIFANDANCKNAVSVCGNGILEPAEDCEVGFGGVTAAMCSKSCTFINACGLSNPPCVKNTPGCSEACTLLGSKSSYSTPSVCGDTYVGTGENVSCERTISNGINPPNLVGPTQIVQAVGKAEPEPGTSYQQTKIKASTQDNNKTISGSAEYKLQCGYKEYDFVTAGGAYNNCSGNADNNLGVGANSCCVPRAQPISQIPADGAGFVGSESVCRNTSIEVVFNKAMRTESLNQNIFLVTGHTAANFDCTANGVQGQNITNTVNAVVAVNSQGENGFWATLWQRITNWTRKLLVSDASATLVTGTKEFTDIKTWCANEVPITIAAQTEKVAGSDNSTFAQSEVHTRVSIGISKVLEANTVYGVLLRGDVGGILDIGGVPMKAAGSANRNDAWFFKTGADICKIKEVGVSPANHVFAEPNSSQLFTAFATSTNGQKIYSTPGYSWTWNWQPNVNPVFNFIQDGTKPDSVLTVQSKTVPGHVTGVAIAKITSDASTENNQLGQTFSSTFELEALFCKRPWPANPGYPFRDVAYNFETGYCADAGKPADDSDDLPYLRQQTLQDGPVSSDSLKKMVFFNDKNTDIIGIQIFENNTSLTEWFSKTQKFGSIASFRSEVIGNYNALTDGSNYYIQALNYEPGSTPNTDGVQGYVYLFSINQNADPKTREVFNKLLQRLVFNINLSEHNLCLGAGGSVRTNPNQITSEKCSTDFDCRDAAGNAKAGTIGTCSNARTKFMRDWKRLNDLGMAQDKIDAYFAQHSVDANFAGSFAGGSFVPGYTVSKWGESWGKLQQMTGSSFSDPLNKWTTCGNADDPQTCWSASSTTYFCPKFKSVYEYEYVKASNSYKIHAPLEFFQTTDQITQDYLDVARFTTQPWSGCNTGAYNPFQEKCGDGILNQAEQCDPPGTVELSDTKIEIKNDRCSKWAVAKACLNDNDCGFVGRSMSRYVNARFTLAANAKGACVGVNGSALAITRDSEPSKSLYTLLSCSTNIDCDNFVQQVNAKPGDFNFTHGLLSFHPTAGVNSYYPVKPQYQALTAAPLKQFFADSSNKLTCDTSSFTTRNNYHIVSNLGNFCVFNKFNPIVKYDPTLNAQAEYEGFACQTDADCRTTAGNNAYRQYDGSVMYGPGGFVRTKAELTTDLNQNTNNLYTCQKISEMPEEYQFNYSKSTCTIPTAIPQTCSEGQLVKRTCSSQCAWQYGSCSVTGSCGNGKVEGTEKCDDGALNGTYGHCNAPTATTLGCTALSAERCGNGTKDYIDAAKKTLEFCEAGVDGFTANYNLSKAKSCSWDCRNYGGYCGDGFVQTDQGEMCDDGNAVDDAKCTSLCQLPATSCLKVLTTPNTGGQVLWGSTGAPTSTTDFITYSTSVFDGTDLASKFFGGESCAAATPRSLCAAANLQCKSLVVQGKNNQTTTIPCTDDVNNFGIIKKVADTSLQSLLSPRVQTTQVLAVECAGIYNPNASGATNPNAPSCGNGIVEKVLGEECDAGEKNDVKCVPGANEERCFYCGNSCKVASVDQQAFCGNGVIDDGTNGTTNRGEKCDFVQGGQIIKKENGQTVPALCVDQGAYECTNNCTVLKGQCVACGPSITGVVPIVSIINPIQKNWSERPTDILNELYFYKKQGSGNLTSYSLIGGNQLSNPTLVSPSFGLKSYADATKALSINQDLQCSNRYSLLFNPSKVLENNNNNSITVTSTAKINGSMFPFVVNAEPANTPLVQDIIMSPAVPADTFRIVLKWPNENANVDFNGALYNEDFNNFNEAIWFKGPQDYFHYAMKGYWNNFNKTALCSSMERAGTFWTPSLSALESETCETSNGIFVSPNIASVSKKTYLQTFTLNTSDYLANGKPFTYYVSILNSAIGSVRKGSVEVLVYKNKPLPKNGINASEISLYSMYEPDYTFKIKLATVPSDSTAFPDNAFTYWQVFNLVKENGVYQVKPVEGKDANGGATGEIYQNGLFHRCSEAVFGYMPGKAPVACTGSTP